RLSVARALARVDAGARLLVLDEPTADLDRDAAEPVRGAILPRAGRATIVLASHDTAALELATSTIRLAGPAGRARTPAEDWPPAHLARDAAERVLGAILRRVGRATIVLASHDTATLELATSTIRIAGPAGRARTPAEARPETPSPSVPAGAARDRGAGRGAD